MNERLNQIDWRMSGRTPRERQIVLGAVIIGIPLIVWALIWQPLLDWRSSEQQRLESRQRTLEWMQGAAAKIEGYRRSGRQSTGRSGGSPEQSITRTAAALGLSLSRMEPGGDQRFNVFFSDAEYKNLLRFLHQLQEQGLVIESLTMGQLPQAGHVSVRMTLGAAL
nr:type II secretion system protein M [Litorivivens lipolytica]